MHKSLIKYLVLFLTPLLFSGCVAKFIPEIEEDRELLVVQGLLTNQNEPDTIKLSRSLPLGQKIDARPVTGSTVSISDDEGNSYTLSETNAGSYTTPPSFIRTPGRFYTLHINSGGLNYESFPMEMKPVPPIDSVYYEKSVIEKPFQSFKGVDACDIFLDTHDPTGNCKFYRWDFSETWVFRLLYEVPNNTCWISDNSHYVNVKSTAAFNESKVIRYPLIHISNLTDRLQTRYSILVNQYSINEDEFNYWEKISNIAVQVGSLYDIIPASVPSNIQCIENPGEKVLGYFSVSAKTSKRIYIQNNFAGIVNRYADCVTDTILDGKPTGLNERVWILLTHACSFPCSPLYEITTHKECTDCTLRGSIIRPSFWEDDK